MTAPTAELPTPAADDAAALVPLDQLAQKWATWLLRDHALKLLAARHADEKARLEAAQAAHKTDAVKNLTLEVKDADGTRLANAALRLSAAKVTVTDEDAFTEWVETNIGEHAIEYVVRVREANKKAVLKAVKDTPDGPVYEQVDKDTGEVKDIPIPCVKVVPGGEPLGVTLGQRDEDAITTALHRDGVQLLALDGGEVA